MADVSLTAALLGVNAVLDGFKSIAGGVASVGGATAQSKSIFEGFSQSLVNFGSRFNLSVSAPLQLFSGTLIKLGADVQRIDRVFDATLGDMAEAGRKFTGDFARSIGRSQNDLMELQSSLFASARSMGVATQGAFVMSTALTRLSMDMSNFLHINPEEAMQRLQMGLLGSTRGLRQIGVAFDDTVVKAELLKRGMIEYDTVLNEAQMVGGRFLLILEQTRRMHGDVANAINSPTGQMMILRTMVKDLGEELSTTLLPQFNEAIRVVGGTLVGALKLAVQWFQSLPPAIQTATFAALGFLAVLGPMIKMIGLLVGALATLGGALSVLITPTALLIGVIVGAIAIFVAWQDEINNFIGRAKAFVAEAIDPITSSVDRLWDKIKNSSPFKLLEERIEAVGIIATAVGKVVQKHLPEGFRTSTEAAGTLSTAVDDAADSLINFGDETLKRLGNNGVIQQAFGQVKEIVGKLMTDISAINPLGSLADNQEKVVAEIQKSYGEAMAAIMKLFPNIADASRATTTEMMNDWKRKIDEFRKLEQGWAEFRLATGKTSLVERQQELQLELDSLRNAMDFKKKITMEDRNHELTVMKELNDVGAKMADRRIQEIQAETGGHERESIKQLEIELAKWEAIGEAGELAAERIREAMRGMTLSVQRADRAVLADLTDVRMRGGDVARGLHNAFQGFFFSTLKGGETFKDNFAKLWSAIADAMLQEMARVITSSIFKEFMGAATGKSTGGSGLFGMIGSLGSLIFGGGESAATTAAFASYGVGIFHGGGRVGGAGVTRYGVSPSVFVDAPRYHQGLMAGEKAAILEDGETVVPKGRSWGGRGDTNNFYIDAPNSDRTALVELERKLMMLAGPGKVEERALKATSDMRRRGGKYKDAFRS